MRNDVALIKLCHPVTLGGAVQAACLPDPRADKVANGEELTVVGWGAEYFGGSPVNRLREVREID